MSNPAANHPSGASHAVRLYFDFLSPYSWLGLMQAPAFAREHDVAWDLRPVVFGKLLDAHGLVGPGEVDVKRVLMGHDVARCAAALGLRFTGPPAHPFRSLEALRAACLFRTDSRGLELCVALADAAWGAGRDLTCADTLQAVVADIGLDAAALAERIRAPEIKRQLAEFTGEAIDAGIFGVPTFVWQDEVFWGQDRLSHLAGRLQGTLQPPTAAVTDYLTRPRAVDRRASPMRERTAEPGASDSPAS